MRKFALALALTLTVAFTAPAYSESRFMREGDPNPITRFFKYVKKVLGMSTSSNVTGPTP